MDSLVGHALSVFMGFFAIMNPLPNIPIFVSLTADDTPDVRKRVAGKALMIAFVVTAVFCLLGKMIFTLFGITLPAFLIAGGVLVAMIGFQMLHGRQSSVHHPAGEDQKVNEEAALSVAVTPLALPILAGPGLITTAMNFASAGGIQEMMITIVALATICSMGHPTIIGTLQDLHALTLN
jgi:multiple antibiotic resistance protein